MAKNKIRIKDLRLLEAKQDEETFVYWLIGSGLNSINAQKLANKFNQYKLDNRIKGEQSDYYYWMKGSLQEFQDFMVDQEETISSTQLRKIAKSGSKELWNDEFYQVIEAFTHEASVYYGRGALWCTSMRDETKHWE